MCTITAAEAQQANYCKCRGACGETEGPVQLLMGL